MAVLTTFACGRYDADDRNDETRDETGYKTIHDRRILSISIPVMNKTIPSATIAPIVRAVNDVLSENRYSSGPNAISSTPISRRTSAAI